MQPQCAPKRPLGLGLPTGSSAPGFFECDSPAQSVCLGLQGTLKLGSQGSRSWLGRNPAPILVFSHKCCVWMTLSSVPHSVCFHAPFLSQGQAAKCSHRMSSWRTSSLKVHHPTLRPLSIFLLHRVYFSILTFLLGFCPAGRALGQQNQCLPPSVPKQLHRRPH